MIEEVTTIQSFSRNKFCPRPVCVVNRFFHLSQYLLYIFSSLLSDIINLSKLVSKLKFVSSKLPRSNEHEPHE